MPRRRRAARRRAAKAASDAARLARRANKAYAGLPPADDERADRGAPPSWQRSGASTLACSRSCIHVHASGQVAARGQIYLSLCSTQTKAASAGVWKDIWAFPRRCSQSRATAQRMRARHVLRRLDDVPLESGANERDEAEALERADASDLEARSESLLRAAALLADAACADVPLVGREPGAAFLRLVPRVDSFVGSAATGGEGASEHTTISSWIWSQWRSSTSRHHSIAPYRFGTRTRTCAGRSCAGTRRAYSLAYSADYKMLVSAGFDHDAYVWSPFVPTRCSHSRAQLFAHRC